MENEKDAMDILLDKVEALEKLINGKNETKDADIEKTKKETEEKEKKTIDNKLKEKMKNRGLL